MGGEINGEEIGCEARCPRGRDREDGTRAQSAVGGGSPAGGGEDPAGLGGAATGGRQRCYSRGTGCQIKGCKWDVRYGKINLLPLPVGPKCKRVLTGIEQSQRIGL